MIYYDNYVVMSILYDVVIVQHFEIILTIIYIVVIFISEILQYFTAVILLTALPSRNMATSLPHLVAIDVERTQQYQGDT